MDMLLKCFAHIPSMNIASNILYCSTIRHTARPVSLPTTTNTTKRHNLKKQKTTTTFIELIQSHQFSLKEG